MSHENIRVVNHSIMCCNYPEQAHYKGLNYRISKGLPQGIFSNVLSLYNIT